MGWIPVAIGVVVLAGALVGYEFWNRRAAMLRYPADGKLVRVNGVAMHMVVRGEGRPVVMLHGNYGDSTDFSGRLRDRASHDFRTVIIDRPGYGHSERPPKGLSMSGQAALLREAIRTTGVERPMLVAHSWSGFLALAYAMDHGSEIAGLVLLNPLCYDDDTTRHTDPRGHAITRAGDAFSPVLRPIVGRRVDRATLRVRFAPEPVPTTEATDPLIAVRRARPRERQARAADFKASMAGARSLAARYGEVTVPLVIVVGDGDRIAIPSLQGYRLHNQLHHSRLIVIEDAGHMIHITRPDAIMDAIHRAWQYADAKEADTRRSTPPQVDAGFIKPD